MSMSFNSAFYLAQNQDVLLAVMQGKFASAEDHFDQYGAREGRNPNAFFDSKLYLINHPDVLAAGMNPHAHFLEYGAAEGRSPHPSFVTSAQFDTVSYGAENPDLATAGITTASALYAHYVKHGFSETRPGVKTTTGVEIIDGVAGGAVGTTFTLTTSVDSLTGTSGNDTFVALQTGAAADETFGTADTLDGGAGTEDTLNIIHTEVAALNLATVSNIENVSVRVTGDGATDAADAIDLDNFTGVTNFTADRTIGANDISNVGLATKLTFKELTASANTTATYKATAVTGTADSASVTLNGVKAGADIELAGDVETISLATTGAASSLADLVLDAQTTTLNIAADENLTVATTFTGAGLTKITATGDSLVTLTPAVGAAVTTIDSSDQTAGGLVATASAATTAVTGGAGADVFTLAATTTVTDAGAGDDTVNVSGITTVAIAGGTGTDTLGLVNGNQLTTATAKLISGFQTLAVTSAAANAFDMSLEADLANVTVNFDAANAVTISKADDALGVTVIGDAATEDLIVSINGATGPGTVNTATLTLDHTTANTDIDIAGVDFAGLETLAIVSEGAGTGNTNSIEDVDGSTVLRTVNISGASDFTFIDIGANNTVLETVNASDMTGAFTFAATNGGFTGGIAITGGSGNDDLTGDDGGDVLVGGAGNDRLNGADGTDTITTGAGTDVHEIATEATLAAVLASADTVTDFTIGTDNIDYNGATADITALTGTAAFGAATSIQTHSVSANLTVNGAARVVAITVEDATTLSNDGASVLDALVTGAGAGTITTGADAAVLFLLDDGTNTALYLGASDVTGNGDTNIAQAEITLVGTYNNTTADQFTIGDFI